jgi:DNA-binding NarL/FixJ family response regulator
MKTETRIFLADDHPLLREGLRKVIEREAGMVIVGEADNGEQALALITQSRPDVAILDIEMPKMNGFEVASAISERRMPVEVVFLTMHKDEDIFNKALDAGAKCYVLKDSAVIEIVGCIKAAVRGEHYISPSVSSYLVNRSARAGALARQKPALRDLTETEQRILRLIAEYKTSKEIAGLLGVSYRTVENHRTNISNKLDLHGSHALLKFALEHKSELP